MQISQNKEQIGMNRNQKKLRKLNMRKNEEFRFLLEKSLKDLPESLRGSVFGAVYAKASKNGILEARDYILLKKKEGIIDENTSRKLIDLLYSYSTFR
ncbi:MAG: hypothetical protein ACP5MU_05240 [Thermoplasmata archaeon]